MAERVFAAKLQGVGFEGIWVGGHRPTGIEDASHYPLFTEEVIEVMRKTLPLERHDHVATGVVVKALKPT
jgi:arsenite methyltransferase